MVIYSDTGLGTPLTALDGRRDVGKCFYYILQIREMSCRALKNRVYSLMAFTGLLRTQVGSFI